jgi:NCS2 family nucleobase:cation symporter-2
MAEAKKPAGLIYGLNETPPPAIIALNGIQHVGLIAINLVYPVLVFRAAGVPADTIANFLALGMLVLGIATFLQVSRAGPVGSGFMCPATFTATYFVPSLLAAKIGGPPLVFGMTMFAGALETALAPLLNRLRAIFPPEISGLIIVMIGISASISGLRSILAPGAPPVSVAEWWVAGITIASMAILNIWGKGALRMLCALMGLVCGYIAAMATDVIGDNIAAVGKASWIGLPHLTDIAWSFDLAIALPFAIAGVAAAMKAAGTITMCQRINDANWVRTDMTSVTRGVLADGLSTTISGALGGFGTNTSTPAVGLSQATGVTSRVVALAVGAMFILLGIFPKLTALLAVMPRSVMLPALLFTITFILINGLQVLTSRLFDVRRTLVIGSALIVGVAIEAFPGVAAAAPPSIAPIIGSSMVSATLAALALNLIFRIGVRKTARLTLDHGEADHQKIQDFFETQAAIWGARPDVAKRATFGALQLIDVVVEEFWSGGPVTIEASFDEFNLEVRVMYRGEPPPFPDRRPSNEEIMESEQGARMLAGFMLRRNADRVRADMHNGMARVHFHFDH